MESLQKLRNNGLSAFLAVMLFFPSAFAKADSEGNETKAIHTVRVYTKDGKAANLKFQYVLDNDPAEPGVYLIGDHDGGIEDSFLPYDYHFRWTHRSHVEEQERKLEQLVKDEIAQHPHRILMNQFQGKLGADTLVSFFENAKSGYELSYRESSVYNRHIPKVIRLKDKKTNDEAQAKFTEIEKVIPDGDITIKNKKTGETDNLSDFVNHLIALKKNDNSDIALKLEEFDTQLRTINGHSRTTIPDVAGEDIKVIGLPPKVNPPPMPSPDNNIDENPVFVPFEPLSPVGN